MRRDKDLLDSATMISALTGAPVEGLMYEPRRKRWSLAGTVTLYAIAFAILSVIPRALPEPTETAEMQVPRLVFLAEPGPGGGGGGGGEDRSEPPSVQKILGEDPARLAVNVEPPEPRLVYDDEKEKPPEEPKEPEEKAEEVAKVQAPVVAQAPDDVNQRGILEGTEQPIESGGSGNGGGSGTGTGTGLGPGEGSGIGPGWGGGIGGGAYHVGSGIEPPVVRRQVRPGYTDNALARKIAGVVVLEVIILRDGTVGPVRVIQSLEPGLDRKAMEAVRQWLFVPGKLRGQAVDVIAEIVVDFTLL